MEYPEIRRFYRIDDRKKLFGLGIWIGCDVAMYALVYGSKLGLEWSKIPAVTGYCSFCSKINNNLMIIV